MGFDDFSALDAPFDKIQIQSKLTESMSEEGSRIYGIPAEYTRVPVQSPRKRNSGFLSSGLLYRATHKNNVLSAVPMNFEERGCYPLGEFRKTRRFTESGEGVQRPGQPLFETELGIEYPKSYGFDIPYYGARPSPKQLPGKYSTGRMKSRRSSLQPSKTSWPSTDFVPEGLKSSRGRNSSPSSFGLGLMDAFHASPYFSMTPVMGGREQDSQRNSSAFSAPFATRQPLPFGETGRLEACQLHLKAPETSQPELNILFSKPAVGKPAKRGAWTSEEDALLLQHGAMASTKNWTEIAEHIPGRSAKQCRERWCFNLDPSIKKELWDPVEDRLLVQKQNEIGNKWAQIAQLLPGRTENAVKTRYKSIVRARKREWRPCEDQLLLELHREMGANWEGLAKQLEQHRTKHAAKMRFKELSSGLVSTKLPEYGSARQTVRETYYPAAILPSISIHYQRLATGVSVDSNPTIEANDTTGMEGGEVNDEINGVIETKAEPREDREMKTEELRSVKPEFHDILNKNLTRVVQRPSSPTSHFILKSETNSFDRTFDDFYSVLYAEEESLAA